MRYSLSPGHSLMLAIWQLAQPATKETVYALVSKASIGKTPTWENFISAYKLLEAGEYIWKAGHEKYIVTPKGAAIANIAMSSAKRDKQRLFYLNRNRKFEVDA